MLYTSVASLPAQITCDLTMREFPGDNRKPSPGSNEVSDSTVWQTTSESRLTECLALDLKVRLKETCISGTTDVKRLPHSWHVGRPPFNENYPRQAPKPEIDLNTHLIRMRSGDHVFGKSMQHKIQVRPCKVPEKRGYHAKDAELTGLIVVVVTARKVFIWTMCSVGLYINENILKECSQLP